MFRIKTILHPTDFAPSADQAFELAASLARDHHALLVILHVATPLMSTLGDPPLVDAPDVERRRRDLEKLLHQRAAEGLDPAPVYRIAFAASESAEIVRVAKETHSDIVVMGTHGRTGLERLILGSVAENVVRTAPCPVMTTKVPSEGPATSK